MMFVGIKFNAMFLVLAALVPWCAEAGEPAQSVALPDLPEAVSSFGAITHGHYLYVYSGHTGREHAHSKDNLSQSFRRLDLRGGSWEELPMRRPVQGLGLVAHDRYIYRIGGLEARNAAEEAEDLHSVADFERFDTESKQWETLPDMPMARSSHDAVVMGNTLYIVGGWCLTGDSDGQWQDKALAVDLTASALQWQELPAQPFQRRALAAATAGGKVVALCGMNSSNKVDRTVNCYDPATEQWNTVAELPGQGMTGFGIAAWNYRDKLFVSASDGNVYCLKADGTEWETVTKLEQPRFFHRLVPHPDGGLLVVGGASRKDHLTGLEWLSDSRLQID
jgi:N-acetylneuraminic acid mutarotase